MDSHARLGNFDEDHAYRLREVHDGTVDFLVYAEVPTWTEVPFPREVVDFESLEVWLPTAARAQMIDPDTPFAFRLAAKTKYLHWFVVGGKGNCLPDHEASFMRARYLGGLDGAEIDAVGVYSAHHRGVFTNPFTNMHIHFVTRDGRFVGHLDDNVGFDKGATMLLPVRGERPTLSI